MTRDQMRKILDRWARTTEMCTRKERDIREYEGLIDGIGLRAQVLTGMPRGGEISDPTAQTAQRLIGYRERIREINEDIAELLRQERLIDEQISTLTSDEQWVLELRYKRRFGWKRIARTMHYCERQAKQIEAEAIDKLRVVIIMHESARKL